MPTKNRIENALDDYIKAYERVYKALEAKKDREGMNKWKRISTNPTVKSAIDIVDQWRGLTGRNMPQRMRGNVLANAIKKKKRSRR